MDTMTYASFAALLENAARNNKYPIEPEVEFTPFYLSYLTR
jgi:hypothetical protein